MQQAPHTLPFGITIVSGYSISVLNHRLISSAQKEDIEATMDTELQADAIHTMAYTQCE